MDELDKKIVALLQGDLPLVQAPYAAVASELGIEEDELLERLRKLKNKGILRRVGAILYHRRACFWANAMVAWRVPEERVAEVGEIMAADPRASHVYRRPVYPDWPYNLFTMLHGRNRAEVETAVREMAERTGVGEYEILFSVREFKKTSMRYF